MCPFHPLLSIVLFVGQKRFYVDPFRPPRNYRDEPELVAEDIEDYNHADSVSGRKIQPRISQIVPVRAPGDPVPCEQLNLRLRMPGDQLPQVRLTDHIHNLMLAKWEWAASNLRTCH